MSKCHVCGKEKVLWRGRTPSVQDSPMNHEPAIKGLETTLYVPCLTAACPDLCDVQDDYERQYESIVLPRLEAKSG